MPPTFPDPAGAHPRGGDHAGDELFERVVRRGRQLRRQRHLAAVSAVALMVVLVATGVVIAQTGGRASGHRVSVAADGSAVASTDKVPPTTGAPGTDTPATTSVATLTAPATPTTTPAPPSTVPAPAPTTTPARSQATATTAPRTHATAPTSTTVPGTCTYADKSTCLADQKMTVNVQISPAHPAAGQDVTFTVTAVDPDAVVIDDHCYTSHVFGDEKGVTGCVMDCSAPDPSMVYVPAPGQLTQQFTHAYAKPGSYTAHFTYVSGIPCSENPYGDTTTGTVTVTVT